MKILRYNGQHLIKMVCLLIFISLKSSPILLAQSIQPMLLKEKAAGLKSYLALHEIEKIYLHFDKPYYAGGDTIYFKAYVVSGEKNQLSDLSHVMYADLIDPKNKIIGSLKLQVSNGLAWGDFTVPDSIQGGDYRIRAYTKMMLNYGNTYIFNKVVPIAEIIENKQKTIIDQIGSFAGKPDIQFFPEGGELVTDVRSVVAFKALSPTGRGLDVKGRIIDNENHVIAQIASTHLGMGSFQITPQEGKTYHAEMNYADGNISALDLPAANSNGIVISVADSLSKISVHINPSKIFYQQNQGKQLGLFIYSGGKLTTVTDVMDSPDMRFDIQKKGLHSGITQITLLSADGIPLCERLVFINKNDQLKLTITTDKIAYRPQEKVLVKLHAENPDGTPVSGHFSVSVVDNSKVMIDENKEENIFSYILLTSNLKGYIEDPGYYFQHIDSKKVSELDLVMLTHGYRRFSWKTIVYNNISVAPIDPEKGLSINGSARSFSGNPLVNGTITLIPTGGGGLLTEKTDTKGLFSFKDLIFYDTARFVLNAVNNKGGNDTELKYAPDTPLTVEPLLYDRVDVTKNGVTDAYIVNSKSRHDQYLKYNAPGRQLKEVKVQGVKKKEYRTQSLAGAGNADQVLLMKDIPTGGSLESVLNGRLRGVVFGGAPHLKVSEGIFGQVRPMLLVVDGLALKPGTALPTIPVGDVESVEVLKYASASIYGMDAAGGVLIITTKQGTGLGAKDVISRGVLPITINGFYKSRQFYSPKYYVQDNHHEDPRSTIYWNAEFQTNKEGDSTIEFFNNEVTGACTISVEGITNDGITGILRNRYSVK